MIAIIYPGGNNGPAGVELLSTILRRVTSALQRSAVDEDAAPIGTRLDLPGRGHPLLLPFVAEEWTESAVRGRVVFSRIYLGGNGAAHGGTVPLLFDEVLGRLNSSGGRTVGRTAYLHVNYRHITPIGRELDSTRRSTASRVASVSSLDDCATVTPSSLTPRGCSSSYCRASRDLLHRTLAQALARAVDLTERPGADVGGLHAASDLHVGNRHNREVLKRIRPAHPDDWLIVAGDVAERLADIEWALTLLRDRFATCCGCRATMSCGRTAMTGTTCAACAVTTGSSTCAEGPRWPRPKIPTRSGMEPTARSASRRCSCSTPTPFSRRARRRRRSRCAPLTRAASSAPTSTCCTRTRTRVARLGVGRGWRLPSSGRSRKGVPGSNNSCGKPATRSSTVDRTLDPGVQVVIPLRTPADDQVLQVVASIRDTDVVTIGGYARIRRAGKPAAGSGAAPKTKGFLVRYRGVCTLLRSAR